MSTPLRPKFDADLVAKYGGEGPRYTSYPTAVQFSDDFSERAWLAAIRESNKLLIPADLSLYVHIPFCSSPCFYCGCNRVITRSATVGQDFLAHLEREVDLVAPHFDDDRRVRQVHLGGGTPTFLSTGQIGRLRTTDQDTQHSGNFLHPNGPGHPAFLRTENGPERTRTPSIPEISYIRNS